jgi:hypothetical protein
MVMAMIVILAGVAVIQFDRLLNVVRRTRICRHESLTHHREILSIPEVDGLPIGDGRMGGHARKLDRAYHDVVRGVASSHEEWRTPTFSAVLT